MPTPGTPHVGFVLEQTLGHVTHADNLRTSISTQAGIDASWCPILFEVSGWAAKVPGFGNWSVRAGIRARRGIRAMHRARRLDALFIHTQVPAVLVRDWFRKVPTVVSLDATPLQYDELGRSYDHTPGHPRVERLKWRLNRDCFRAAGHLVTWSAWAKQGLIRDYGVSADKVTVIPPGVRTTEWTKPDRRCTGNGVGPVRVLFVGGDFRRKGGDVLLDAVRALRADGRAVELQIVTGTRLAAEPGVTVHNGMRPNSAGLKHLYQQADIFCLPTRGDCLPMVLSEAGATGLPLVATDVGAIAEIVRDGETGLLLDRLDARELAAALDRLVGDAELRMKLGENASMLVRQAFDAEQNALRLVELLLREAAR